VLAGALRGADPARQARLIEAHSAVARLGSEAPQFNYDAAMLAMELGGLIAAAH
jgi:DNA polymerase-3 subunit delta'